jgi:hypothetical protein
MNRKTTFSTGWMEILENRLLFSAAPVGPVLESSPPHTPTVKAPQITTPNVIGTYTGNVTDSNEKKPGKITLVISSQTNGGKITGYVESTYPGQSPHTTQFTGTITGDSFTINTSTTTVTGTVSSNGKTITASYNFKSGSDSSVGHFVANRSTQK